jgi:toxin ParE1/3/4
VVGKRLKPLVRRARADRDVLDALDYYLEVSEQAADGFVDAIDKAYAHVRRAPGTGSPRYGHELNLPGLRFWPCSRYPYLVFYVDLGDRIEVWRVLHGQRDIPRWLQEDGELGSR